MEEYVWIPLDCTDATLVFKKADRSEIVNTFANPVVVLESWRDDWYLAFM